MTQMAATTLAAAIGMISTMQNSDSCVRCIGSSASDRESRQKV
jgi:hypothetical protein